MRLHLALTAAVAAGCLASPASAALLARPGGVFYDTVLDITWSGDANWAKTFGFSGSGLVTNAEAEFIKRRYFYYNAATDVYYDTGWRLPTLGPDVGDFDPLDEGFNGERPNGQGALGTGWGAPGDSGIYSELGWMFYANLGGHPRCLAFVGGICQVDPLFGLPRNEAGQRDTGPFANLELNHYWTDVLAKDPETGTPLAYWSFTFSDGNQSPRPPSQPRAYVWLVHDGDVGGAPVFEPGAVPEPATWALLLAGFGAIGAALRRRRALDLAKA
jgi:hypothetical protein